MIGAFLRFANHPDREQADALPFAERVRLGLGSQLHVTRSAAELADPDAWAIEVEHFRAAVGPFSALELARNAPETTVSVGEHPHCVSPPTPAPVDVRDLRRVSVQPSASETCLQWWSVDFFMNDNSEIEAVTLDFWEP